MLDVSPHLVIIGGDRYTPFDPTPLRCAVSPDAAQCPCHPFGTDEYGRDVLSRVLAGAHLSLAMGFGAMLISLLSACRSGCSRPSIAARRCGHHARRRPADLAAADPAGAADPGSHAADAVENHPRGRDRLYPDPGAAHRAMALACWRRISCRLRCAWGGRGTILWQEILPNAWPPIIVECGLRVTFAILLGSSLSFLGLGPQPPSSEWGLMIAESRRFIDRAPWTGLAPGCACVGCWWLVNLLGEGLREIWTRACEGAPTMALMTPSPTSPPVTHCGSDVR